MKDLSSTTFGNTEQDAMTQDYGQRQRPERERALPEYVRNQIDMARSGFDIYGNKLTRDEARAIIGAWLPNEAER